MRSYSDKLGPSGIKSKTISVFDTQYSNIPPFHYSIGRLKVTPPLWGEIKAGSARPGFITY